MFSIKPHVSRLYVYPIKSLDREECDRANILESGAIEGDRTWAIFDLKGNFVNGKRNSKIHNLRSVFNLDSNTVSIHTQAENLTKTFNLNHQQEDFNQWLSQYFGFEVVISQNRVMGFPDDTISPGATIISTATIEEIASWYPELEVDDIRRRFRANIEIGGVPAFWEDCLFTDADSVIKFRVGEVEFMGVNPCQRCVVVTRDPQTGKAYPQFQKIFVEKRKETLPTWSERSRFNHFFRLAVNTKLSPNQARKTIAISDPISLT